MIKRTYEELEPYFPAGHFGVTCKRYHGKDETGAPEVLDRCVRVRARRRC